jgi:predicted small metal-binding protein
MYALVIVGANWPGNEQSGSRATVPTESASKKSDQEGGTVKTMSCKDLGGKCDQKLSAGSWDEMVKAMTKHVIENHPDVAREMEKMHKLDPKKWGKETKPKWDAAPEV